MNCRESTKERLLEMAQQSTVKMSHLYEKSWKDSKKLHFRCHYADEKARRAKLAICLEILSRSSFSGLQCSRTLLDWIFISYFHFLIFDCHLWPVVLSLSAVLMVVVLAYLPMQYLGYLIMPPILLLIWAQLLHSKTR